MREMISSTSNTEMTREGSDSNSVTNQYSPNKPLRQQNSSCPTRFKGVVLQQNGHWGAQIYANHQRIWLGTFKSEKTAAMAYDSAAIKLRSGDTHRNFPWTSLTIQEPSFQDLYSTEAVLNMIKDGSYESKFEEFLGTRTSARAANDGLQDPKRGFVDQEGVIYQLLFQKELTPSDVGKLNRLVIPKKHAIKYFPPLAETSTGGGEESDDNGGEEVQLEFLDSRMHSWKFRYCYWKSSQSFVFTRGWNRFVKDKALNAKDVVVFYECRYRDASSSNMKKPFWMIDVAYNGSGENGEEVVELQLGLGGGWVEEHGENVHEEKEQELPDMQVEKRIKLFGFEIKQ